MEHINKLREFYEENRDRDSLVVSLTEGDLLVYMKEVLQFTNHKKVKLVRDLGRINLYFER